MRRDLVKHRALVLAVLGFAAAAAVAQDRSARERIAALSSSDAVVRAMAACELGRMRAADVGLAREPLLELIGDDTPVEPKLCRDWDNGPRDEPSSPGREAAMALEELGADVLPELTELLRDARPAVREHAAFALGLIESDRSIEPLARVLRDGEARVRSRAAWSLGMIESARGVEPLLGALSDDADWRVRERAAWALGMIESADAVESLIGALADAEPRVREQVAWALGMIESASAAEAIADALERETDDDVRRQLVWALGRVIDSAELDIEPSALAALLRRSLLGGDR